MKTLAALLVRFQAFRAALISAGWLPPEDMPETQGGGGSVPTLPK